MTNTLKSYILLFFPCVLSMIFGCIGPEGPKLTGELTGYAGLVSNDGILLADKSGILVQVEGTSLSATTDLNGRFSISDLLSGTYTLSWTRAGYGVQKHMGYQFVGGGATYHDPVFLGETPSYTAQIDRAPSIGGGQVTVGGSFIGTNLPSDRRVRLFFGPTQNVSSDPSLYTFSVPGQGFTSTWTVNVPLINITRLGIPSGARLWVIAYSDSWISSSYTDMNTGKKVYPDLNATVTSRFYFDMP